MSPVGLFKTAYASDRDATVTFAFSGDTSWQWKPYPLLNSIVKEKLDFFYFLGDLIYESTDPNPNGSPAAVEDLAGYRYKYRQNREPRSNSVSTMVPMLDLYRSFGQYSVFDNHELGLSLADKKAPPYLAGGAPNGSGFTNRSPGFRDRIGAYQEYQPLRESMVVGAGDPRTDGTGKFYNAVSWGANVDLITLDDRSYRDAPLPTDNPGVNNCDRSSVRAMGESPGTVSPLDFANVESFGYAVITADHSTLTVQVKGIPFVVDASRLADPSIEKEYESQTAQELLSFQIRAQ